jgi:radical SAM superfamily enzyme YgiQ (UPF0313 family)
MKLDRILMVEPKALGHHVYSRFALPRLGLPILAAVAQARGIAARVIVEGQTSVTDADLGGAGLLCLSTITPTATRAYEIADHARAMGVPVVLGGAHPTALPEEGLAHADWVLTGEADRSFGTFLDALGSDGSLRGVPGAVFKNGRETVKVAAECGPPSFDEIPRPDLTAIVGTPAGGFHRGIIPVMTSRGCPHSCRFCSVTAMFGRAMRFDTPERVADTLERLRGRGEMVFFYDDNFCASPGRTKVLLDHLLTRGVFLPPWIAQVSVRAARDPELLRLMERARCHTVFVGFESIDPNALAYHHKKQDVDDIRRAVRRFHDHGIGVHGMFVFGTDVETAGTIRATTAFALAEDVESVQYMVLTPLPGTPLFDEMRRDGRLLTTDWSLYDAHHAVFRPARMTPHELMSGTMEGMAEFYSLRHTVGRLLRHSVRRAAISLYAAGQVRAWLRQNRALLRQAKRSEAEAGRRRRAVSLPVGSSTAPA